MFDSMLGHAPVFQEMLRQARAAAAVDVAVLIIGETGTGKELLAQALRQQGGRAGKPYVTVNCAAIALGLAESELFGHRRGSFTGADSDGMGRFRAAHGGTLFLDEVDSLPLALQPKLLRFLESGEIQPVGETSARKVNVRVIAATHANLGAQAASGEFRSDLYYRLNVLPLEIPPLRRRREDIPLLAAHFMREAAARYQQPEAGFSAFALERLAQYPWPGNIRELRNICERLAILRPGSQIMPEDLPPEILERESARQVLDGFARSLAGCEMPAFGHSKYGIN
jgi:two-component system response regulator HydG